MFLNLQIRYVVDSWVEFVTCRKALSTRESQETGHYICYKYVNGILLRFDDAHVNRVDLLYQYNINLIMYRRYDIDPHKWEIELGFVEHLNQVTYGLRHPPIHGTRYSLCHRDITEHEHNPNGSVIAQKANTDNVGNSGEEPLDMRKKEQNTITTSLTSQELPLDMSVSRETVPANTTDNSDPKNLGQCDDILSESNQLEHDGDSNVSPVDIEGNEESVQNIREENSTSQEIEPASNVETSTCEVNKAVTVDENGVPNICQETTVDTMSQSQLSGDSENNHNNLSENTTAQTPTSKEGELENSSPKAVDCLTEVDSQGKIQLSEFDETVDYNTGELSDDGDSSSNSSSGRSPDENDKDEPVNKKRKPDLSLKPPLITKSTANTPKPKRKPKPRPSFMRPKPQRVQPSRAKKSTVQYIPFSSDSDNDTSEDDSKDDDFVPEGQEGYFNLYHHI